MACAYVHCSSILIKKMNGNVYLPKNVLAESKAFRIFFPTTIGLLVMACAKDKDNSKGEDKMAIRGTVSNGVALTETKVLVFDSNNKEIGQCMTDASGNFSCKVDKSKVTKTLLLESSKMRSLLVEDSARANGNSVTAHINPITDHIATQFLSNASRNSRSAAQTLQGVTAVSLNAEVNRLTRFFGIDAKVLVSGDFVPRVSGEKDSGSIAGNFIESLVEHVREGGKDVTLTTLINIAAADNKPVVSTPIIQIRLAAISLANQSKTAKEINTELSAISTSAAKTAIGTVFETITTSIAKLKTEALANAITKTNQLTGVAITGLKQALISILQDKADSAKLTTMVDNTTDILQTVIVAETVKAAGSSILKKSGVIDTSAINTVISNATKQAATVLLSVDNIFTETNLNASLGFSGIRTSIGQHMTDTATIILTQVGINGLDKIEDAVKAAAIRITAATTRALVNIAPDIIGLGFTANPIDPTPVDPIVVADANVVQTTVPVSTLASIPAGYSMDLKGIPSIMSMRVMWPWRSLERWAIPTLFLGELEKVARTLSLRLENIQGMLRKH